MRFGLADCELSWGSHIVAHRHLACWIHNLSAGRLFSFSGELVRGGCVQSSMPREMAYESAISQFSCPFRKTHESLQKIMQACRLAADGFWLTQMRILAQSRSTDASHDSRNNAITHINLCCVKLQDQISEIVATLGHLKHV